MNKDDVCRNQRRKCLVNFISPFSRGKASIKLNSTRLPHNRGQIELSQIYDFSVAVQFTRLVYFSLPLACKSVQHSCDEYSYALRRM